MIEPPPRHPTAESIDIISRRLGLRNDPEMQDWEFEVADAKDLDRYLALFEEVANQEDLRFTLASMIIQAFEDSGYELETNSEWAAFLKSLVDNMETHRFQIWYWANWDAAFEDAWKVSPFMRILCETGASPD